jgi:hypothetical protein
MFAIEKDVPVAAEARGAPVYPFAAMEPGDSFLVPDDSGRAPNTVRRSAGAWGTRHGMKMTVRKVPGGLRVWRLA